MNKKLIIRHEYGQLGNILFRLSNTLAFAIENGYRVEDYTLSFCNYHDGSSNIRFFENYHPFHFFEYPRSRLRIINRIKWKYRNRSLVNLKEIENFIPSFNLLNLESNLSYKLKGFHFSSGNLVTKHRSKICNILKFRKSETLPVRKFINEAKKKYETLLGVHIRQNDYKTFYAGKYLVSLDRYLASIEHFKSLHPNPKSIGVVICSDDDEVLVEIQKNHPDYFFPMGNIAQDIAALSQCFFIISPKATTASSWAAYYGDSRLLQIDQTLHSFDLESFKKVKQLEPFNPCLN